LKIEIQEGFAAVEVIIKCPKATEDIIRIESLLLGSDHRLSCSKDGTTHLIDRKDVLYFESVERHCFIYTTDNVYETPLKLYEIEELLTNAGFFRSAKAQILNIAKIVSLCPEFGGRLEVVMENRYRLIVSRQYAKLLKERVGIK
jgi:DNA-binding LytR/AlgR family response regulator